MKSIFPLLLIISIILLSSCQGPITDGGANNEGQASDQQYYQLKIYNMSSDDQVQVVDEYLKTAYLPALERLNISNIGVFKSKDNDADTIHKTYVLIPYDNIGSYLDMDERLRQDQQYVEAGADYINASHDDAPYDRIESILMRAFADHPVLKPSPLDNPRSERIYELRSYESATERLYVNKVDMFNAGGEIKLFDRLDFNAVFYAEVISGGHMPNLMYMTTHSDKTSRSECWEAFVSSAEWQEMKDLPKYANTISHADVILLEPTTYSDY